MKILFINPPNKPFTEKSILIEPIDILILASYIEKLGHNVHVLDMDVKRISPSQSDNYIKKIKPDISIIIIDYHIPLHKIENSKGILEIARICKKNKSKVIVGGKLATFMPQQLLFKNSPIDIAISREMELPLTALLKLSNFDEQKLKTIPNIFFWDKNKMITAKTKIEKINLNDLSIPNRNLVNLKDYIGVRTMITSRGCTMKCEFCHVPGFWGNWRGRSPTLIVKEIELLVKKYKAKKILFLDDNATADKLRIEKISDLIIQKRIKVKLGCLGTIASFDEKIMRKMRKAGFCWIHYGIESGDEKILKKIKKNINAEKIKEVIAKSKKLGFRVRTSWIMDFPQSDKKGLAKTIKLILETQSDEIRIHYFSLRFGSELYKKYGKNKFTEQYIHNAKPKIKNSKLSANIIESRVKYLNDKLQKLGYTVIRDPKEFSNLEKLKRHNNPMKILSLCPMRYGINW